MSQAFRPLLLLTAFALTPLLAAQPGPDKKDDQGPPPKKDFPFGGPGFKGPPMGQQRKLVKQFDKDGDGRLNQEERQAARDFLKKEGGKGGPGFFGKGPGGFGPGGPLLKPILDNF